MNENNFLPPETNRRQRILVADDDRNIRVINTEILAGHGYDVTAVDDGAAAWDELQLNHYDLLVTDNEMPRLSGVELIRQLHDAHQSLPVIMVTGSSPYEELARQPELHVEALLLKPYTMDELLAAVKNVLQANNDPQVEIAPFRRERLHATGGQSLE